MESDSRPPVDGSVQLTRVDRFKRWNAYLFIACGAVMIYRSFGMGAAWLALLTGVAFLAFGAYRLRLFHRAMRGELPPPRSFRRRMMRPPL